MIDKIMNVVMKQGPSSSSHPLNKTSAAHVRESTAVPTVWITSMDKVAVAPSSRLDQTMREAAGRAIQPCRVHPKQGEAPVGRLDLQHLAVPEVDVLATPQDEGVSIGLKVHEVNTRVHARRARRKCLCLFTAVERKSQTPPERGGSIVVQGSL